MPVFTMSACVRTGLLLEESAARRDFRITSPELDAGFWRYYRDESNQQFFKPGSAEEAKASASPPWLADQPGGA
jgi:hypothetical protein